MVTLYEVLKQAETEGVAVGHFNVSDLVTLKAVFESASDQNVPVIVGVSEGERQFLGVRQASNTSPNGYLIVAHGGIVSASSGLCMEYHSALGQ